MNAIRMLDDIRNQPASLSAVLDFQFGEGWRPLLKAADGLRLAPRIIIAGMGASHFAAIPAAHRLTSRGVPVHLIEAAELLHYDRELGRGAAVVLVSRSGNSVEITSLMPVLKNLGATIVGITNEPGSALAREAHHVVIVNSVPDEMVAVQSYTGSLFTTLLLAAAVTGEADQRWRTAARTAIRAISHLIEIFIQPSLEWRPFLERARVMYLIGRGPSLASVHEGALLFNETSRLPSVAVPAGGFRHGPVEVADAEFHAIVFATQEETRDLDLNLAADLAQIGAQVRTISPSGSWPAGDVPSEFLPLAEIIPIQLAALRAAECRGIRPGRFRYVSQVTTSETGFLPPTPK